MAVATERIELSTSGDADCLDVTAHLRQAAARSGVRDGVVHVFVIGSTAALTTIEYEPGCLEDLRAMFERVAPQAVDYAHHARWGDHNGHSHMRASLLGPHLAVPLVDGEVTLGTWQQVVLVDFDDRPRRRSIVVQILGE